jgi:hypothetical protein
MARARPRRDSYGVPSSAIMTGSWCAKWGGWTIGVYESRGAWHAYFYGLDTEIFYSDSKTSALEVIEDVEKRLMNKGVRVFVNGRASITLTTLLRFEPMDL